MRSILNKILIIGGVTLLMLQACKKDGTLTTISSNGGTAGTLSVNTTTLVLDKTKLKDTSKVIKFSLTDANYGFTAATTATLQLDVVSDNFKSPQSVTLSAKVFSQGYSTADFNSLMLKLGLPGGKSASVAARVMYSATSSLTPLYSNVVTLTVTPFNLASYIYAVGAFQGWNASNPDSLLSATGNGVYVGTINIPAGGSGFNEFLILPAKNFNNKWATSTSVTPTTSVAYNANNNIKAPAVAGWYTVTFDSNLGTIAIVPTDYYSIIGDATAGGWGSDTDMKFNNGTQAWEVTAPLVSSGQFKIRKDHDWGTSYGLLSAPDGLTLTSANGANIPVPVNGTYKVSVAFNILKADGSVDFSKCSYTLVKQ